MKEILENKEKVVYGIFFINIYLLFEDLLSESVSIFKVRVYFIKRYNFDKFYNKFEDNGYKGVNEYRINIK